MTELSDAGRILQIYLAVLTQYKRVTDRCTVWRTDGNAISIWCAAI